MGYNGYSTFEVVSTAVVWVVFVAVVVVVYRVAGVAEGMIEEKKGQLRAQGVNISKSGVTVQTARVAPSREEVIASTQRAIETSAAKVSAHRDAFRFGDNSATIANVPLATIDDNSISAADQSGVPPPGSAAAEGLAAAKGQGMTTSFGAVRGGGTVNEGQVPVGAGEAVDSAASGDARNSKRSLFKRNKKAVA
ncbi:hypothetical protein NliqN6_5488 [Naganishia liquefaciens]|uniref:Uncharacterized protein n=1 Tax=Naganishia liquefaciens TaxID=104408 RepID=A0A8H3TWW4_9TREE|nr:hypothetical protein NliqN6_5488 [Naganishia liquefaciens]